MSVLKDGYKCSISIGGSWLLVKTLTPPSIQGGGKNDTTTQANDVWRTGQPKALKTLGDASFTAAYSPAAYANLMTQINVNQEITVTFPDNSTVKFWGWLDEFNPKEMKEGEQPEADCKIICSNQDNAGAEQAPEYTAGSSTTTTTTTTLAP